MCQELIAQRKHVCRDVVDEPAVVLEWNGCGNCGQIVKTQYLGGTTLRTPCDDCQDSGAWVLYGGVWMEKDEAEAAARAG